MALTYLEYNNSRVPTGKLLSEYIEGGDSQEISSNYQAITNKAKKGQKPGHKGNSKSISHTPNPNILADGLLGAHEGMTT
jgi:hypothetical protein